MKRTISKLLILIMAISIMIPYVNINKVKADNVGTIKISVNKTEIQKGDKVKVTVSVTSKKPLLTVQYKLKYDEKAFSYPNAVGIIIEQGMEADADGGFTTMSKTYEFTAIGTNPNGAKFEIELQDEGAITDDLEVAKLSITNATVKVVDKLASANANLSGIKLSTGYLWPSFTSSKTVYAVGLDYSITSLSISCPTEDPKAKVSFDAKLLKDLPVGQTDVIITVTAENGTTKKYTLQVVRYAEKESESQSQSQEQTTSGVDKSLTTEIDGKKYSIVKDISVIELPKGYELSVEKYGDTDIAVAQNKATGTVLAYLISEDGQENFFIYNVAKGTFSKYLTVSGGNESLIVMTPDSTLKDMVSVQLEIGEEVIVAWTNPKIPEIYFFYGMNSKGEKQWYSYDAKETSIQRAYFLDMDTTIEKDENNTNDGNSSGNSEELDSAYAEIGKLNREIESLRDSKKLTTKNILITVLIIVAILLAVGLLYVLLKLREANDENDALKMNGIGADEVVVENLDEVAATVETVKSRKVSKEVKENVLSENNISENEEVKKDEIDIALDKISEVDEDDIFSFLNEDDDII